MAVIVILDLLNESCAAVNSPGDTLVMLHHVSALLKSFDADLFLIKIMQFFFFSLFFSPSSRPKSFPYVRVRHTLWEEHLLERYANSGML